MAYGNSWEQTLRGLTAPRRNRYYYGKMLDVVHLQMEQDYGMQMRWLGNRLSLGSGVLCGLRVFAKDGTLCVDPGVAVDAQGREIVVPGRMCLDPWRLTDRCGQVQGNLSKDQRHLVTLYLCYNECLTDQAPVLVSDCDQRETCEAGTVVETFRLEVREGQPQPRRPLLDPKCCDALFTSSERSRHPEFEVVTTIEVGGRPIAAAASADGTYVVVANQTTPIPRVQVIRVADNTVAQLASDNLIAPLGGITLAPDGGLTFVTHASGIAVIDHTEAPPRLVGNIGDQLRYGACAAARGGAVLFAIESNGGVIHQINTSTGVVVDKLDVRAVATHVAVSADSKWLFVTREKDNAIIRFAVADIGNRSVYEDSGPPSNTLTVRMHDGLSEPHVALDNKVLALRQGGAVRFTLQGVRARDSAFTSTGELYYVVSAASTQGRAEIVVHQAETLDEVARLPVGTEPSSVAIVPGRMLGYVANAQSGTVTVIDGRWGDQPSGQADPFELLCQCTAQPCPEPTDACVPLAAIELREGGEIGRISECAVRTHIYSNQMLLDLILCLAARLDECCIKQDEEPRTLPKVASVKVLDASGDVLAELTDPSKALVFRRKDTVRSLRVVFTESIDRDTVVAGGVGADPKAQSFLVMEKEAGLVPGSLAIENPTTIRWDIAQDVAPVGRYMVRLSGDGDIAVGRPAITSSDGIRLDGEPLALPSGDDVEGGAFQFRFGIVEEIGPEEPPKVASVFISDQDIILAYYTDPRDVPAIDVQARPGSILIYFTAEIDPSSVVATGSDPGLLNFRVTEATTGHVPGTVTFESPTHVRWTAATTTGSLGEGAFVLQLFGDTDENGARPAIAGINHLRLDGEPGEELPSGDDEEGGEFRISFRVVSQTQRGDLQ